MLLGESDSFVQGGIVGGAITAFFGGLILLLKQPFWRERRKDVAKTEADRENRRAKAQERADAETYKQLQDAIALYQRQADRDQRLLDKKEAIIEQHLTVIELLQQRASDSRQELAEQRIYNAFMYQHLKNVEELLRSKGQPIPPIPEMPKPRDPLPTQNSAEFLLRQAKQNRELVKAEEETVRSSRDSIHAVVQHKVNLDEETPLPPAGGGQQGRPGDPGDPPGDGGLPGPHRGHGGEGP